MIKRSDTAGVACFHIVRPRNPGDRSQEYFTFALEVMIMMMINMTADPIVAISWIFLTILLRIPNNSRTALMILTTAKAICR